MYSDEILKKMLADFEANNSKTAMEGMTAVGPGINLPMPKPTIGVSDLEMQAGAEKGLLAGDKGGKDGSVPGALSGISSMGNAMYAASGFNDRYSYDPELQKTQGQVDALQDGVASAFGPWGEAFRGIQKAGSSIGNMFSEEAGDITGGIFDPTKGMLEVFKNEDATSFEKFGSALMPFASGLLAGRARKRTKNRLEFEANEKETLFEKKKLDQEYQIAEGLESMESLKALRKKQIGL